VNRSAKSTTARTTVTTGSHVLSSEARAAPTRGRPARNVEIATIVGRRRPQLALGRRDDDERGARAGHDHRARADRRHAAHDTLAEKDVGGVDDGRGDREDQPPRDVELGAADEEHQAGKAAGQREHVPARDRPAQEEPAGDDDQARIDVDDQHAQ
jgi:hypothetical protein